MLLYLLLSEMKWNVGEWELVHPLHNKYARFPPQASSSCMNRREITELSSCIWRCVRERLPRKISDPRQSWFTRLNAENQSSVSMSATWKDFGPRTQWAQRRSALPLCRPWAILSHFDLSSDDGVASSNSGVDGLGTGGRWGESAPFVFF